MLKAEAVDEEKGCDGSEVVGDEKFSFLSVECMLLACVE